MRIKGLETSKNLLRLLGENVSSSSSDSDCEEQKAMSYITTGEDPAKQVGMTELPEGYDLVEEVLDEEEALSKLISDLQSPSDDDARSVSTEVLDDAVADQMRL